MPNQQKPELIELLINSDIIPTANDDYVNVINPERPQGFAEHFAQLLSRTPNIHSPNKPEFFPHFFLGSVVTLPYTDLMSKLKIDKILFDIKKKKGSLKLVFKIKDQTGYKLKLFIVTDNKSAVSFTDQELSDIKSKTSDSKNLADAPTQIECHVLEIVKGDGLKLRVLSENISEKFGALEKAEETKKTVGFREIRKIDQDIQQFGPLIDKLSSANPEDVKASVEAILKYLKNLYTGQKKPLAALKSEAAYHGFIHGFFALNYKYTNGLDCYSEQRSGNGDLDFRVLSRHDSKGTINRNHFSITLEIKDGGGAENGIAQLKDNGYARSPNVRTRAEKAIIAALDWSKKDNEHDLKVEIVDVHIIKESLVGRLIDDIQHFKSGEDIHDIEARLKKHIEDLYYNIGVKHKDSRYFSRVLVGQSVSLEKQGIESFFFQYDDVRVKGMTTLLYKDGNRVIGLNILEGTGDKSNTRSKTVNPDWYMIPLPSTSATASESIDFTAVQIVVNIHANSFESKAGEPVYIQSTSLSKPKINSQLYKGTLVSLSKVSVSDIIYSIFDHHVTNVDENLPPVSKKMKLGEVEEKQEKHKKVDVEEMLRQCFNNLASLMSRKKENDVQAILQGLYLGQKYEGQYVIVFPEPTYGGGRGDLAVFIEDKDDTRKEKVLLFETKICKSGSSKVLQELSFKSTLQLTEYVKYLKSSTDSKKVVAIPFIYSVADKKVYLHQLDSKIDHTSHSSGAEQVPSTSNQNYRQGHKSIILSHEILSKMFEKKIFDFSKYHLDKMGYILLKNFLIKHRPATQEKITCVLNLSNQRNIIDNIDIVAEILQHDLWISDLIMKNCDLKEDALTRLTDALISKERLEVSMNGSPEQKAYLSYLSQDTSSGGLKVLGLRVLDLSGNVMSVQCCEILSRALSHMLSLKHFAASHLENAGLQHIFDALMHHNALVSLKVVKLNGGLDTKRAEGLVALFDRHPNLHKLYASHNSMGQSNIDTILHGTQKKGREFKVCDLSYNKKDSQEVINTESLKSFISFYRYTLETLKWGGNGLGDQGLNNLSPSLKESNIRVLALSHNQITEINGDQLPSTLTGLIISHNKITSFIRGESKHLENLVDTLDITYNPQLSNVCDVMNLAIAAHTQHLGLSNIDFSNDLHVTAFNELWRHGKDLTSLSVPNCNIGDYGARILFDRIELHVAGGATKLKKLNCEDNHIEINDARVISGRSSNYDATGFIIFSDSIEEVSFKRNKIGNKGGKHLLDALQARSNQQDAREQRRAQIEISIDLSENQLTDGFVKDLSFKLPLLKGLKSLELRGNIFNTASKNQLVNALGHNGNTDITNLEIDGLAEDEKLRLDSYLISNAYGKSSTLELRSNADGHFEATSCLNGNSGRSKRFINDCKISWDDVDEISREKTRDKEKVIIDAEKFLKYSKQHVDDIEKSKQLVSLVNELNSVSNERIVGKYQNTLDQVIKAGCYKQYLENDRINYLSKHPLLDVTTPKSQAALINHIGRMQMMYGGYSTFVSCAQAGYDKSHNVDCILGTLGIGYATISHQIEKGIALKVAKNHLMYKMLGVSIAEGSASMLAKGFVEAGSGVFDIIDITRSAIALDKCSENAGTNDSCGDKEIRDHIASISLSGISFISGISLALSGAGALVSTGVGVILMAIGVIYNGISNVIEYSNRYKTTIWEDWSIFWRTALLQDMASNVKQLAARYDSVNSLTVNAWKILLDCPNEVVAISFGFGKERMYEVMECDTIFPIIPNCTLMSKLDSEPDYAFIDMSQNKSVNTLKLSRVLPDSIENAKMLCLPAMDMHAGYEIGVYKSFPEAVFECLNAAAISHKEIEGIQSDGVNQKKTVIHYLSHVNSGFVVGSSEWNNDFIIFSGNANMYGTSVPNNVFELLSNNYTGEIYLHAGSNNVLNLSKLDKHSNITAVYHYADSYNATMVIETDAGAFSAYAVSPDVTMKYVGSDETVETIQCATPDIIGGHGLVVDSGGVSNLYYKDDDLIINCGTVVLYPNTIVRGSKQGHVVYVPKPHYTAGSFVAHIETPNGADVIFQMSLFEDCEKIEYSGSSNHLTVYITLPEGGEYRVVLYDYRSNDNITHYTLRDRNGAKISPLIDFSQSNVSSSTVKNFLIRKDIEKNFVIESAIIDYKNLLYVDQNYHIYIVIGYSGNRTCMFGSIVDDLIIEDDNVVLMHGGEGKDVYTINENEKDELYIHNSATDLSLDFLTIPSIQNLTVGINALDVELHLASKNITLCNYLLDKEYQHIVITDHQGNAVIPYYGGSGQISLQPFYYSTSPIKNVYILSYNSIVSGIISIHSENISFYKQENDLIITDKRKPFGILSIVLKDYYIKKDQWAEAKLYSYDDGTVGDIIDLTNIQLSEIGAVISNIDNKMVNEYLVDLSEKGAEIDSNALDMGVISFKNTLLDHLSVIPNKSHLILHSSVSNHSLILKNWHAIKDSNIVSFLEFNNGLEASRVLLSADFEQRINLNNKLSNILNNIEHKLLLSTLDDIVVNCPEINDSNQDHRYHFLEDEKNSIKAGSRNFNTTDASLEFLDNKYNHPAAIFMLLSAKHYNKILLAHPNIDKDSLHKIDDMCFNVASSRIIDNIVKHVNSSSEYDKIPELCAQKNIVMEQVMEILSMSNTHHKHRHHHGDGVKHQKTRRNINEYEKADEEIMPHYTDGMTSDYITESVFELKSDNSTWV